MQFSQVVKIEDSLIKQLYAKNYISRDSPFLIKEAHETERISETKRIFLNDLKCENQKIIEKET
jgi:hypothetical protein